MSSSTKSLPLVQITEQSQIDALCKECIAAGRFSFDTEFVMEDCFEADVCLVQVATPKSVAIIDPHAGLDPRPICELVCSEEVTTVVHAGQEDLAISVRATGRAPRNIVDVQIVAGLAGYDYPLSLQRLVRDTLHIRLQKSKTLTDWRKRPLTDAQIRYGAADVEHLIAVQDLLAKRLSKSGRSKWAIEECAKFEDITIYNRVEEDKLARVKGSGSLRGRQLAVLRDVLAWREQLAKSVDRPARVVLKDFLLVEVAKHELHSLEDLRNLRGLNLSDKNARSLGEVVSAAMATPKDKWPAETPRDSETPKESALVSLLTGVIKGYCLEQNLAYALVASKKPILHLIRYAALNGAGDRGKVGLLRGWRAEAIGSMLERLLAGNASLHIDAREDHTVIRVADGNRD